MDLHLSRGSPLLMSNYTKLHKILSVLDSAGLNVAIFWASALKWRLVLMTKSEIRNTT